MESDKRKLKNEKNVQKMSENFGALSNPRRTSFRQNSFSTSSRTLYYLAIQTIWSGMVMLRLRKALLKAQKNVILDFEQEFIHEVGPFFCWACTTLPRKMCKKNLRKFLRKIFLEFFKVKNWSITVTWLFFYPNIIRFWCLAAQMKANIEFYDIEKNNKKMRRLGT